MRLQATLAFVNLALALAGPTGVTNPFSVSLSSVNGNTVDSIDDLIVVSSITNTADKAVKVVQYGGVLDGSSTQSFIVRKGGEEVRFAGVLPQLVLTQADEAMYRTIQPGETVTIQHRVASLYDFADAGVGEFTFEPLIRMTESGSGALKEVPLPTLAVQITKDVEDRHLVPVKRATDKCTDAQKKAVIDSSYTESKALAKMAADYIGKKGAADTLYKAYFKDNAVATIKKRFDDVANENVATRTLNCADPYDQCKDGQTIAYTVIRDSNIYFCDIFYDEVATNELCHGTTVDERNIRGGTSLHEMVHANSVANSAPRSNWVVDIGYGCPYDQSLSAADQARNADNHNCFATAVYKALTCP
jgi:deuterolysin